MAGWSRRKREMVEKAFYAFLNRCYINSKDYGRVSLGEFIYWGQRYTITQIFDALEADIHDIYILKSRQLGISTLVRALIMFFEGMFPGLKGAIVFDTDQNKQEARAELEVMINDLPKSLKFPAIKGNNRAGLTLSNDSKVLFMSAGVRKSKTSGTLGRSVGLALATLSELCSYDNDDGLEAFEQSLSDVNPDRLYIRESTARGFNRWWEIWNEARKDSLHKKCIFLGWFTKDSQRIEQGTVDFEVYGKVPPTTKEIAKIKAVKEQYNFDVSVEQLAWIRRKMDPAAQDDADTGPEFEGSPVRIQEQPWCVVARTMVGTERGIVPIEEAAYCAERTSRGKIIKGGPTGKARIWKVKTKLGYELEATANHPLITADGQQVDLSESLGCRVRLQPPMLNSSAEDCVVSWREPPALCTVKITAEVARFVGLFMGDGSASKDIKRGITCVSICCCGQDGDVVEECSRLFKDVFCVDASVKPYRGWVAVSTGKHCVLEFLRKLELIRNDTLRTMRRVHVPHFIWRSSKPIIREFLRGLFEADGFNAYGTNRVALFSKYPEFIRDIQLLLLAFGITSRAVSMKKKAADGHFYTGNQLELRTAEAIKFNEEIGFISARKRGRYDPVAYEKKWKIKCKGNSKRPYIILEDEIASVEDTGRIEEVWNLTVEGDHLFDANGILTHNTEDEAFQQTGAVFFAQEKLTELTRKHVSNKFKGYMFWAGAEFADMRVYEAENLRMTELKVWEEPDHEGMYVLGADPAYGENENNDRSALQVFRCYSDGLDQVAEYAWPLITTYQLAWVIAGLLGWYGQGRAEIRYILELNGPGMAVFNELKALKQKIDATRSTPAIQEKGLADLFRNVRTYIYTRSDSLGSGYNFHFKTNIGTKVQLMERLRDFVSNGKMRVRSMSLIDEMKTIAREGDSISAPGSMKDDRVFAAALACHAWETKLLSTLLTQRRTRDAEASRRRLSVTDQVMLFNQNHLDDFFKRKQAGRVSERMAMLRNNWRAGAGRRW